MYINLEIFNSKIECGIPTGVYLEDGYELKTGDEVNIYTYNDVNHAFAKYIPKYRTKGVVQEYGSYGLVQIITNRECCFIENGKRGNIFVTLSKKQEDYKKGEEVARGKVYGGFIVE